MPLQIKSQRRMLVLWVALAVLVLAVIAYPIFTFKGIPSALFYRRQERQFCIRCGRQEMEESRMSLDGGLHKSSKLLIQPKIDGIDAEHCDHWFLPTASKDGFFEIRRFRWIKGTTGDMDGDHLFKELALIRAFASLSAKSVGNTTDLFMLLRSEANLRLELLDLIQKEKASPEKIEQFLQERLTRQRQGVVIPF